MATEPELIFAAAPGAVDPVRAWACAIGAPLLVQDGMPLDTLVDPESALARAAARTVAANLQKWWKVDGRDSLVDKLDWLGRDGHRRQHLQDVRYACLMRRPTVAARREELRTEAETRPQANEEIYRLNAVQANHRDIRASRFLAFDAARGVMLTYAGRTMGWLDEAESWDYLLDLARDVQHSYGSWPEYAADFLRARNFWNGADLQDRIVRIVDTLQSAGRSPWQLPWHQPELSVPRPVRPAGDGRPVWRIELLDGKR